MNPSRTARPARRTAGTAVAVAALFALGAGPAAAATPDYKNCTTLHKTYPHGVGRTNATDHTTGKPVTTFKHSTKAYKAAMAKNSRLDADKDGIACEKR
jgi:uncharacterized membrane protein